MPTTHAEAPAGPTADSLSGLTRVLTWAGPPDAALQQLEARYVEVLGERLGEVLATACRADAGLGNTLLADLQRLDDAALRSVLLTPATSRRLVTRLHAPEEVWQHLAGALRAAAGAAPAAPTGPSVAGLPVVLEPADEARLVALLPRIAAALAAVGLGCEPAARFVRQVTRRLVLRIDVARDGFSSNSPQGYVGQAVLSNPHLPLVDDVVLAEALVHESIHGFVGMSEAIGLAGHEPAERWIADASVYEGASCTVSPWTGKPLDLPTYLHACFVWWGLLHLWSALAGAGLFDERRLRSRLARAARGFRDGQLVRTLQPHRAIVHPALLADFEAMGREVDALLGETGLDQLLGRLDAAACAP